MVHGTMAMQVTVFRMNSEELERFYDNGNISGIQDVWCMDLQVY